VPLWLELLDAAGLVVLLVLLYGLLLVVRRRVLSRHGGTFELSLLVRPDLGPGRGWLLGLGRYSGEELEWFRIFTLAPRPKQTWSRNGLSYDRAREPEGVERTVLYPDHLVVDCVGPRGAVELAMSRESLTGFQAWLEARPPGTDWSR
jgi:Protein of unknown function (DUF2550)